MGGKYEGLIKCDSGLAGCFERHLPGSELIVVNSAPETHCDGTEESAYEEEAGDGQPRGVAHYLEVEIARPYDAYQAHVSIGTWPKPRIRAWNRETARRGLSATPGPLATASAWGGVGGHL